jgi:uncharacterized protein (TIGR02217 family)
VPDAQDCVLGAGDGVRRAFQLVKGYASGGETYLRPIAKPVPETVRVAVAGVSLRPGQFAVDATTGLVTLAQAPGVGVVVTAGFMFDVPVRFDTDRIEVNLAAFEAGAIPSIPIVEVRV